MIKTVLFDLDGTLLPMNQDLFVKEYLKLLCDKFYEYGYNKEEIAKYIIKGIKAMYKNKGPKSNEEIFFEPLKEHFGQKIINDMPVFMDFYHNEFQKLISACQPTPKTRDIIEFLKKHDMQIIIATNPLFPHVATSYRLQWAGINKEDLLHFTTYEDYCFTKPSLSYYQSILNKYHLKPEECLMVGNDVDEDMIVSSLNIKTFLLTDCIINRNNKDISIYPHGTFEDLKEYLKKGLPQ